MAAFTYALHIISKGHDREHVQAELNRLGRAGWQVVGVQWIPGSDDPEDTEGTYDVWLMRRESPMRRWRDWLFGRKSGTGHGF